MVAGAFNLASDRVLYGRYWGCFEEHPFLHFNVCLYAGMDEVVRRGLVRFEPGAGGEHKLVRGFTPSLTYSAHALFHRGLDRAVRGVPRPRAGRHPDRAAGVAGGDRVQGLEGRPMPERVDPDTEVVTESTERAEAQAAAALQGALPQRQLHHPGFRGGGPPRGVPQIGVRRRARSCCTFTTRASAWQVFIRMKWLDTKIDLVEALAREHEFPLRLTMEPEEI